MAMMANDKWPYMAIIMAIHGNAKGDNHGHDGNAHGHTGNANGNNWQ